MNVFVDLDELILRCRDEYAKEYIKEAVLAYKAGAYRSSIVATWNAVVFDYLHKLKELSFTGDKNAQKKLDEFMEINKGGKEKLKEALNFEKEILNVAEKDFELITPIEHIDLGRIQEDRNRCAHPSMQNIDEPYAPTAELARNHIRNAVEIMLKQEPVQGKAALRSIIEEIKSDYFPTKNNEAKEILNNGPLKRAKSVLVRNLIIVLIKDIINEDIPIEKKKQLRAALSAIIETHRETAEKTIRDDFSTIISTVNDDKYKFLLFLCCTISELWDALKDPVKIKLKKLILNFNCQDNDFINVISAALSRADFNDAIKAKIKSIDNRIFAKLISRYPSTLFVNSAIDRYSKFESFDEAEDCAQNMILPLASFIEAKNIERILAIVKGKKLMAAWDTPDFLCKLFEKTQEKIPESKKIWNSFNSSIVEKEYKPLQEKFKEHDII